MSEASQPASVAKKGHWTDKIKDENAELKRRIAELEASAGGVATAAPPPPPVVGAYDAANDPLAWIGESVDNVHLVGKISHLTGNTVRTPANAEDVVEPVKAYGCHDWTNNPFSLTGRSREEGDNLRIQYAKFHHLRVDRFYAERVYASKWAPMPKTAVMRPEDFAGRDHQNNPYGKKSPCSTDPLRELVRYYLQRYAGSLWLNKAFHPDTVDFANPNPYGAGKETFLVDPATVKRATADGTLKAEWELGTGRR